MNIHVLTSYPVYENNPHKLEKYIFISLLNNHTYMLMRGLCMLVTTPVLKPWNQTGHRRLHPVVRQCPCSTCFLSQRSQKTQPR